MSYIETYHTYRHFGADDVDKATEYYDEIENVPGVAEVVFETKGCELEYELEGKYGGEDHVETVEEVGVSLRLLVEFHGEGHRVYHDQTKDRVLERLRRNEPPNLVLDPVLGNVAANWLRFQRELDAVALLKVKAVN